MTNFLSGPRIIISLLSNPVTLFENYLIEVYTMYGLTTTMIPPYKVPLANSPKNTKFNLCLSKSCIRNEHMIGKSDMHKYIQWVYCCIILHNILAYLDDVLEDLDTSEASGPNESCEVVPNSEEMSEAEAC
ncbi:hypothetical protein VP01_473g12 [Puccinia sorghi]|uniref:DDE Tnp4 domain-containing protein n=1 Tax=Puccinia sorghi TaxID=27349 RepID=A0A0L6UPW8_9BASI|nr:hypothetical protein VP01_473g12 [Puccinia sorghi]